MTPQPKIQNSYNLISTSKHTNHFSGYVCYHHECVPHSNKANIWCFEDENCPKGATCKKSCFIPCIRDDDCPSRQECKNYKCLSPPYPDPERVRCKSQDECLPGFICSLLGICHQQCHSTLDCVLGK